jgi:hypothetical protein
VTSPGSFADWSGSTSASAPGSTATGWGAAAAPHGSGPGDPPSDDDGSRSWLPWALTGAGVGLIVVLVGFMAVSILGSSSTPSSSGLSAAGSSTTSTPTTSTRGSGASSSTAAPTTTARPTTTTLPPPPGTPKGPPGSVLYIDPGGSYSVSVGGTWTRARNKTNGLISWSVPPPSPGAGRASYSVTSSTMTYSLGLTQFVALTEEALRTQSNVSLLATNDIRLADGVPATVIRYESQSINGVRLQGEAIIAVGSSDAYVETVIASPQSADATFAQTFPYLRTLHVEN